MKNTVFYIIYTIACAWIFTKLLLWVDSEYAISQFIMNKFPLAVWIIDNIHQMDLSIRVIVFFVFLVFFFFTEIHRYFGYILSKVIGVTVILFLASVIGVLAWQFISWILSTL